MDLQTAFYIISIIYMCLMIILFIVIASAVLIIKAKIDKVDNMIDYRVTQVKTFTNKVSYGIHFIKNLVSK